ncbi:MAG: hypothetical protein ACO3MC_10000, partial [Luminiphilus sp.]
MKGADGMLPHYRPEDEIPAIVSALETTGAVIIEDLLPEAVIAGLNQDLRPEFDREGHLYQN